MYYWSSSAKADVSNFAWSVFFNLGAVGSGDETYDSYVRCVR